MTDQPISILGFSGVDSTTDELLLPSKDPRKSQLVYNYRARNNVKRSRGGFRPVIDVANENNRFKFPGVYFPHGSYASVPLVTTELNNSFYIASTDDTEQEEFSIEFWYKGLHRSYDRTICMIPVDFVGISFYHMTVRFYTVVGDPQTTRVALYFATYDGSSYHQAIYASYSGDDPIPMDDEWHHIALVRGLDTTTEYPIAYVDTVQHSTLTGGGAHKPYPIPTVEQFLTDQECPQKWNYLQVGDDSLSIAEFRMWNTERTSSEISNNAYVPLDGDEEGLVCYIPFDEGTGKHFEEKITGARGYFSPQEPFVNENNELVFTGRDCLAFPSLRARWRWESDWGDDSPFLSALEKLDEHPWQNEDGAYDGGILWDTCLYRDLGTVNYVNYNEGILRGTAQMRFTLRQLKEGVLCGRLGLVYDTDSGLYRFYFYCDSYDEVYESLPVVGDSSIGVEKTITIIYNGVADSESVVVSFYLDDTNITDYVSSGAFWSNGDDMNDSNTKPFRDSEGDESSLSGALGGSTEIPEMCIAFDLIFFRQWYDRPPVKYYDEDDFVEETYDLDILQDRHRIQADGIQGYFHENDNYVYTEDYGYVNVTSLAFPFIRLPVNINSDGYSMDGGDTFVWVDKNTTSGLEDCGIFKQDVLVKRVRNWNSESNTPLNDTLGYGFSLIDTTYTYEISYVLGSAHLASYRHFNGATISSLVNDYNYLTFKKNRRLRPVYWERESGFGAKHMALKLYETIEDDTPIQGVESIGGINYKSRYLQLTALGSRDYSIYGMKSFRPRWCTGPLDLDNAYPVRCICRYKSENGNVNKLFVVVGCSVYSLDENSEDIASCERGWLDRNSDIPVNFVIVNNRLILMDNKEAIKLNYLENFSRLGIERPVDVYYQSSYGTGAKTFTIGEQYAWVARFVDEENNARSGTIPVFSDMGQTVRIAGVDVDNLDIRTINSKDSNINQFEVYRTLNLGDGGAGVEDVLFLVKRCENNKLEDFSIFRDVWTDTQIGSETDLENPSNSLLSSLYYGQDLVPKPSYGMAVGYKRLWIFGNDDEKASLYFSTLDAIGFGIPDEFPEASNRIIVDEGGTSRGTALIEFSNQLFAFKEDAIFRIYPVSADNFGVELIYKGVGALNQRCVVMAGNQIILLDKSGPYKYKSGEPSFLVPELISFFQESVNKDEIEKSFILYNKDTEEILIFVPSRDSSYCDLCIVFDMRTNEYTIDLITDVTCGYVDDGTVYVGTLYGQIFKYDPDTPIDCALETLTGSGSVT